MIGNSVPNEAIAPTYTILRGNDLEVFDALPPEFRAFIRDLPIEAAAAPVAEALQKYSAGMVLELLYRNRALIMERLAQEMAEALAR